jgi:hypothetical protein
MSGEESNMATRNAAQEFAELPERISTEKYNYKHFRTRVLLSDARRTVVGSGVQPGEEAPDFELARAGGGKLRLSELRDKPVLLHFGSYT